jgi:hypothetical protein
LVVIFMTLDEMKNYFECLFGEVKNVDKEREA